MSIYHKWQTIFVQIPKNATVSIHEMLRNKTDDQHNHATFIQILENNDIELVEQYFSFSCVRNPYDKFVSAYEYRNQDHPLEFRKFIEKIYNKPLITFNELDPAYYPQYRFITIKNIILVDQVIKFENLEEDWKKIVEIINKRISYAKLSNTLEVLNVTPNRNKDWKTYYTPELKDMIYQIYKKDFELFKYDK